jgi:dipeptidase E
MGKIVAIGGGEIGRPGYPAETTIIDKEIIRLTGKKHPRLLFLPTATGDSGIYVEAVNKHFGRNLGCKVETLYLYNTELTEAEMERRILYSDSIYVGGGNTLRMMRRWKKTKVDKMLRTAYEKGIVLAGVSAGAICWFKYGNSDSRKLANPDAPSTRVRGLGLIDALLCPHYNDKHNEKDELKKMMLRTPGVAVALDSCCAIEIVEKRYRIMASKKGANAYRLYWKSGRYYKALIEKTESFVDLQGILQGAP